MKTGGSLRLPGQKIVSKKLLSHKEGGMLQKQTSNCPRPQALKSHNMSTHTLSQVCALHSYSLTLQIDSQMRGVCSFT